MEINNSATQVLESAVKAILAQFDDPAREGLKDTPARVSRMYQELLTPGTVDFTTFQSNGYDELIVSRDIPFYSLCEHHLLPFFGTCTIGYLPAERIVGISKLARAVDFFSHRLNTQEYMTQNIAKFIDERLAPRGIGVIVQGRHLCQEIRGIKRRSEIVTSCLLGTFQTDPALRQEFLKFVNRT